MTAPDSTIQDYWQCRGRNEDIIPHSGEVRVDAFREHPVWLSTVPLLLRPTAGGLLRVADMGCGTGIMAEHLARLGHSVIAIDFAESRLAVARRRLAPFAATEVRVGDVAAPPLEPGEVDAIVSRNLLWLLPDPVGTVARWRGLLPGGGRVAAIDATWRRDRTWLRTLRNRVGGKAPSTPLGNAAPGDAAAVWRDAGLTDVREDELTWVSQVRRAAQPLVTRVMTRSRYFVVCGDVP